MDRIEVEVQARALRRDEVLAIVARTFDEQTRPASVGGKLRAAFERREQVAELTASLFGDTEDGTMF